MGACASADGTRTTQTAHTQQTVCTDLRAEGQRDDSLASPARSLGPRAVSTSNSADASASGPPVLSRPSSNRVTTGFAVASSKRYFPAREETGAAQQAWMPQQPITALPSHVHSTLSSGHRRSGSPSSISILGAKVHATFLPPEGKQALQPQRPAAEASSGAMSPVRLPAVSTPGAVDSFPPHPHRRTNSVPSAHHSATGSSFPRLTDKELVIDASVSAHERAEMLHDDHAHFSPPHTPVRADSPPPVGHRVASGSSSPTPGDDAGLSSVRSRVAPLDMLAIIQEASPAFAAQSAPQQPNARFVPVQLLSEDPPQLTSSPVDHAHMPVTPALAAWMRHTGTADPPVLPYNPRPAEQQPSCQLGESLSSLTPTHSSSSSSSASASHRRYSTTHLSFQPSDRSILLCDTEPDDAFVQALQTAGYSVVLCVGALEAVELLTPDPSIGSSLLPAECALTPADFHLVICDANASLPQGQHLVDWLQLHTPELPIFLATHDDRSIPSTERWLRRGVQDVIRKNLPSLCINELFTFFTTRLQQQQLPTLQEKGDCFKMQVAQQASQSQRNLPQRRSSIPSQSSPSPANGAPVPTPILLQVLVVSPNAAQLSETLLGWLGEQFTLNFVACSSTADALQRLREARTEPGASRAVGLSTLELMRSGRSACLQSSSGADLLLLDDTLDGVDAEFAAAVTSRSGLVPLMLLSDSEHSTPASVLSLLQRSLVGVLDLPLSRSLVASKLSLFLRAVEQHRRRFLLTQRAHAYRQLLQQMRTHGGSGSGRAAAAPAVPSAVGDVRHAHLSFNQADLPSFPPCSPSNAQWALALTPLMLPSAAGGSPTGSLAAEWPLTEAEHEE